MTDPHPIPDQGGYHYAVMRRAIDLLDRAEDPLTLEEVAREMDMSPAHFQRLFSRWVGVSPKRYQQYLMLGQAKEMLQNHATTLEAAHEVGLSGTGRLHDMFLRWEAMSPGTFAQKGAGLTIYWGWFESPFGPALVMGTEKGICGLALAAETGEEAAMEDLRGRWPQATYVEDPMILRPWVLTAFGAQDGAIGAPKAVRAGGTAVGRNPVSWLIPCHRALRKSGALGGYHWGLPVKRAMLAFEAARAEA